MLLADTGVQSIGFPEAMVSETLIFPAADVQSVNGQRAIQWRERRLPVFELTALLALPPPATPARQADLPIGLAMDQVLCTEDIPADHIENVAGHPTLPVSHSRAAGASC